ncbi:MAG TPA: response regulator [Thermoanaerobaculia bacterium]|nr:response regulator [Thermoanaerobaculia bacterium]
MPTILLVDDDEPIRLLITAICSRLNVTVEWAGDGEIALSMLRRRRYDAVLLDLMLPKQNGFEILREVRSFAPDLLARTIIITAASDATLRDFDGGGTLVLLRKPFDIADLMDALVACTGCDAPPPPRRISAYTAHAPVVTNP